MTHSLKLKYSQSMDSLSKDIFGQSLIDSQKSGLSCERNLSGDRKAF